MIREFFLQIAEALFWVMGGVPLVNSPLIFVWVFLWVVVMASPVFLATRRMQAGHALPVRFLPFYGVLFFLTLFTVMGPPIIQIQMLQECRENTEVTRVDGVPVRATECRTRSDMNRWGEWGPWELTTIEIPAR